MSREDKRRQPHGIGPDDIGIECDCAAGAASDVAWAAACCAGLSTLILAMKAETRKCPISIEGVAGRRRRTDPYPKHVDQADRRLDWREVIQCCCEARPCCGTAPRRLGAAEHPETARGAD